ncbi:hypothetical protein BDM02DRAFT_3117318 [Thelephora ganbajun]|uniref:Uncharacterized protein n=1 Tax=Thelephora ganbajun TaxID=370292 RepID=A0ACB6ZCP3_THEGA|nr:hypothetical protein BDM02DRAFT_3117318 [Thelephora ganbajun]
MNVEGMCHDDYRITTQPYASRVSSDDDFGSSKSTGGSAGNTHDAIDKDHNIITKASKLRSNSEGEILFIRKGLVVFSFTSILQKTKKTMQSCEALSRSHGRFPSQWHWSNRWWYNFPLLNGFDNEKCHTPDIVRGLYRMRMLVTVVDYTLATFKSDAVAWAGRAGQHNSHKVFWSMNFLLGTPSHDPRVNTLEK